MGKLVDTDELYADFRRDIMGGLNYDRILREAKPVDAVPVVHGYWIKFGVSDKDGNQLYRCSVCKCEEIHSPLVKVNYCWNCGARMNGKGNGNETD